jgi:O-antigen/teichoic acid export membrane protein
MPSFIKSLLQFPQKSAGLRQSAINITGSLIASGLAAIAIMLISRSLGPAGFGQFSTAFALSLILVKFNDLGLSTATSKLVPALKDKQQQQFLLNLITRYRLFISLILILVGLALAPFLAINVLKVEPSLVALAVVLSLATTYFEHTLFSLQSLHRFSLSALINILQAVFKLIFTVAFIIWAGTQEINLLTQVLIIFGFYMLSPILPVLLFKAMQPGRVPLSAKTQSFLKQKILSKDQIKNLKQNLWSVVRHASWGIFAAGIIENIDILFVQAYLTDYEAGLLGGVNRIAMLLYILAYALGNVLNPRVARYTDQNNLKAFWSKAWLIVAGCVLGFVFSMFLARPLITLTIGVDYLPALPIMRVLLAAGFMTIAVMPFVALFYAFDKPWYFSISGIVQLVIVLMGNGLLVPIYGLEAAAWTRFGARAVLLVLTMGLGLVFYRQKVGVAVNKKAGEL